MPRPHRRNALACVAAATACLAAWLATAPHSCLATNTNGVGLEAAAGAFQWDRATYWTLDPPPKADFLPEDEELIRVPRPAAKPAAHQPPPTRRILWLTPEDGPSRAETNSSGGRLPTRRRRRAVERTVVSGRGLQDWLGIPGPPPGNRETRGQVSEGVASETAPSTLRGSKYVPRGHQSDELSADKRNERNLHIAQASQKWSPTAKGVNSPSQFAVPKSPGTQIDTSGTSKMGSEDEQEAVNKEVQSQEIGLMRRIRSQPYNGLGYPVHDGPETAENRHEKLKTLSTLQSTKNAGNSNAFSRNVKDEDRQLLKKISGRRRLLWFQERQDENRRSSFRYGEISNSTASGPSSGSQSSSVLNQYGSTASPDTLYRETRKPSSRTYVKVLRRPISPGMLSSLDVDPLVVQSGDEHQKVITPSLAKVFDEPQDVTENTERKYRVGDLTTFGGTVTSHATRHSSWTVNSSDKSESKGKVGDRSVLKQEELAEMRDSVSVPVENSTTKEGIVSRNQPRVERSVDGTSAGVQDKNDGVPTPNGVNLDKEEQRRIGRRLLGISPHESAPPPAKDMGADGEMTKEEEDALREQVVRDVVGDLLGVDGSGDGSGWGEIDS